MTSSPTRPCGCPDYDEARLALSRRALLGTALAGGAVALGPSLTGAGPSAYAVTGRSAAGLAAPGGSVLVILSLRGAADGLSLVVPHADPVYYAGTEVITVDQGDWDMHTDAGTLEWGEMLRNAGDLASSIAAFFADLGPAAERVTLVTLSEFGRRVRENDDYGTDHGFGNVMFVAGAGVRGGRYYGAWPGLSDTPDADLLVTTDYRSVLTEVVTKRFGVSVAQVFPGFSPQAVGVMA